jgi:glycosyltransferase involved in cell wall biosynthesis
MVCDNLLDGESAQTIHVLELFNNLSKLAKVYLFVPKQKNIKFKSSTIKYIPRPGITKLGLIFYQIILFLNLFFYCKKMRIDAIYARQSGFTFSPLIISKLFGIPYFVEINGLLVDEMKMYNRSKIHIKIAKLSEKINYKHAKKIIAVTEGVKEGIKELYNISDERIIVIENGANTDLFKPMESIKTKKELKFEEMINYICFVGNLAPWQGVGYLIQSAPLILAACPEARFLIVGDGVMKNEWIQFAQKLGVSNKFIFTGTVPYEEVPKYINASDVCVALVMEQKSGQSSLKNYEYMACGKPIVARNTSGYEIFEEYKTGILVNSEDKIEVSNAIIKLLSDDKLRKEMGANGRRLVVETHSWESVAKKVAKLCGEVIR